MDNEIKFDNMLIVIGAMKCGTSSLHEYLKLHPEISMSRVKELDYFSDELKWANGLDWYRRNFDWSRKVQGESSPNYSKCHLFSGVPEKMAACMPEATLVYIMRDPIDRIISHYQHSIHHSRARGPLAHNLADLEDNNFIETSRYFKQLQSFLEYYERDQILLFTLKELQTDPGAVCRTIFNKVDVDPDFYHPLFHKRFRKTRYTIPRSNLAIKLSHYAGIRAIKSALPFLYKKMDRPPLDTELHGRLVEALTPDIDSLREYWGNDLSHWSV